MRFLIKKTPDNFIKSVNDEISSILNRNFDSLFPEFINDEDVSEKYAMPVELHEHEKEYVVNAEIPGIKKEDLDIDLDKKHVTINAKIEEEKEDLDISLNDGYLTISATKTEEKNEGDKTYKKSEFSYGEFSRTIYFPQEIDIEKATADLEHGILKITAPKKETAKDTKKLIVK